MNTKIKSITHLSILVQQNDGPNYHRYKQNYSFTHLQTSAHSDLQNIKHSLTVYLIFNQNRLRKSDD